ncbi:MAG: CHASE domain-containing protein [Planctomycetota bacterium]|nr:CHASE domain-containing protein [Planctomycetota bacterium]
MWRGKGNPGGGEPESASGSWRLLPTVLAAVLGTALTIVVFDVVARFDRERVQADFDRLANERIASVRDHAGEALGSLEQVRGLYNASNEVERSEFHDFAAPLLDRAESLSAIAWAPRVEPQALSTLEAAAKADGLSEYSVKPDPGGRESFPVYFRESRGQAPAPFGQDLWADPTCRQAMEVARDSGQAACTAPVAAGADGPRSAMVFVPIYLRHPPTAPGSATQRRERLAGFIVGAVSPRGVLLEAVRPLAPANMRLRLYDLSPGLRERFLYGLAPGENDSDEPREAPSPPGGRIALGDLDVAGRTWQVAVMPGTAFGTGHRSYVGWTVLAGGLFITGLAAAYVTVLLGQARRIRREVDSRTADLRREIANREKVEQALRLQKAQAQQYLDVAGVLLVVLDRSGRVVMINRKGSEILALSEGEILGADWFEAFVPEPDRAATRAGFDDLIAGRGEALSHFENRLVDASGRIRLIAWDNVLVHDDQGDVVGALSSGSDMTAYRQAEQERRYMEAQVLHAQKLESLGILAGGIAHDFNNILTAVLGNADLALRELPPGAPARGNLHEIAMAARRAADLCRQLLAYSGKGRFVVEPIDLSALIEEMAHLVEVSISKKVVLRRQFAAGLPAVDGDATQLRQVVINLVTNASEAIGEAPGEILVTTDSMVCDREYLQTARISDHLSEGRYVTLEVSDDGCGIDADTLERIFDPFFSTKFAGRGLGLAAVMGIVRGHKGGIKVYSEPGQGTSFKVFLPASDAPPRQGEHPRDVDGAWRGRGTVLLVDDEECVRTLGRAMLTKMGFSVLLASDGREGLDVFRARHEEIVCVVLDLTMPHMDGEETFRILRSVQPDIQVILCSGYNEQDVTQRFVGKGLAGFIQKPFEYATLASKLRQAVEG